METNEEQSSAEESARIGYCKIAWGEGGLHRQFLTSV